jgi:ATP-dependent Clp protease protease subunit
VVRGDTSDLEIQANEMLRTREQLEALLVRHTGRSAEQVTADLERDKIFGAEEAVAYGLADLLTTSRKAGSTSPGTGASGTGASGSTSPGTGSR